MHFFNAGVGGLIHIRSFADVREFPLVGTRSSAPGQRLWRAPVISRRVLHQTKMSVCVMTPLIGHTESRRLVWDRPPLWAAVAALLIRRPSLEKQVFKFLRQHCELTVSKNTFTACLDGSSWFELVWQFLNWASSFS